MIFVFATICLGTVCHDELVTSTKLDPMLSMQWCTTASQPALADWLAREFPGYELAGWRCELGERKRKA